tara:strand:+ start:347 stop:508 length:162 start_codon:yes stop_codon:yes gene_type:complete
MKYCLKCNNPAKFIMQWGPKPDQKEYACENCLVEALEHIPAIELFVVKIGKLN